MKKLLFMLLLASCSSQWKGPFFPESSDPQPDLKHCFVGDTGKNSAVQQLVARALEREKCHEIYVLGDVIYDNGITGADDPQLKTKLFNHYGNLLKQDHKPKMHIVLGNHDYNGNADGWIEVAKKYPSVHAPARRYIEKTPEVCYAILDSNLFVHHHRVNLREEQGQWMPMVHRELNDCKLKVALAHHPYYSPGPNHKKVDKNLKAFYEKEVLGKFDFFMAGHEHIVKDLGIHRGTRLLITGAGGALAKGYLPGYVTMEWQERKLSVYTKEIEINGKVKAKKLEEGL